MKVIKKEKNKVIVRLESGEEFISSLRNFALQNRIGGGWFWAIGACDDLTLAFYDLKRKKYISRRFRGRIEIVNITGNISRKGKEVLIHAHGAFSKPNYTAIGGHIMRCVISATCEIYLEKLPPLRRALDSDTGLNLLTR